jgi:hypothetical protein
VIDLSAKRKKYKKKLKQRRNLHGLTRHAFRKSLKRGIYLTSANSLKRALKKDRAIKRLGAGDVEIIITKNGVAAVVNPETKKVITTYKVTTTNEKGAKEDEVFEKNRPVHN